jgi:hypothetical protein
MHWKSHNYYLFECVFPACSAHVSYCHLRHVHLYNIFPHYLINGTIFEKKNTEHIRCCLIFSTIFVAIHVHEELCEIWSQMYIGLHVKYPLFLSDFNLSLNFLYVFSKNTQVSNFIKIRPVWAQLFHDMKLTVAFRNFTIVPKI